MRKLRANGLEFAILEEGTGPLVLLVHGFPDTAHSWDRTLPALAAAGYRAVAPFTRGYAPTEIPADGDYRVTTLAADVAALIEALGETSAVVVGHDWGAATAIAAANTFPERVRLLVTLAIPHPAAIPKSPLLFWKGRHFITLRFKGAGAKLRKNDGAYVDELVKRWSPAWAFAPSENDAVKKAFAVPGCAEAAAAYYKAASFPPPRPMTAKVAQPALAFAGATDPFMGPSIYERARRHYRADYEVVTLPGGHFLHREHPDQFNAALLDWLAKKRP